MSTLNIKLIGTVYMKVKFTFLEKVNKLEQATKHRYTYVEISDKSGLSRHTVRKLMTGKTRAVDLDTLGKLLDFFVAEGMPVTVGDLFATE